jgi:hypothetical protein
MDNSCKLCGNELHCNRCIYCSFECTYEIPVSSEETRVILPNPKDVYKKFYEECIYIKRR